MKAEFSSMPFQRGPSEALVHQIMSTFHMSRAEATAMALSMLFRELIIVASLVMAVPEEAQGAA